MSRPHTPAYTPRQSRAQQAQNASSSRSGTPLASKPVISLEEWERLAPLGDEQLQSINVVKERFAGRPLPESLIKAETSAQGASRATSPHRRPRGVAGLLSTPSRAGSRPSSIPPSPNPDRERADPVQPLALVTPQQFHDHFTALTLSTEHEQDSLYRDHLAEIVAIREKCDAILRLLEEGEGEIDEMLKCLSYVEERSESLRGACEDLLEEQTHLLTHTSQLAHRLTFFTFLENAQRMLNNPSGDLVLSVDFLPMVKRLDECIGYLADHRDFQDAEVYLLRYQQCMTRSMTLIKIFFVNTIKAIGQEVSRKLADRALSETAIQALVYNKFVTLSTSVRPLIAELEHRVTINPNELHSLLSECHTAYLGTRSSLMAARVSEEVAKLDPRGSDLVDLTRAGCSYLKQTCLDEFNLYKHIFLSGESQLYGFLETLCDHLYDHLRPRILHEPSLETLCGVCTVLQALMVQDVSLDGNDDDDTVILSPSSTPGISPFHNPADDYFSSPAHGKRGSYRQNSISSRQYSGSIMTRKDSATTPQQQQRRRRKPLTRLHTEVLLKMVLQDAQTRLVFRAQALVQADVQYYAPKDGDLDYPEKLGSGKDGQALVSRPHSTTAVSLDDEDDDAVLLSLPPPESQETWYPTLRVTLWVLSCLYTYVDTAVFDDLAQEALTTCRRSLTAGSELLGAKKDRAIDGRLFLVRHLLILKEMTAGLQLGKRDRTKDWSGITDFLRGLLDNASSILGYSRTSVVRANEHVLDAKIDIDRELKRACEDLIRLCATSATQPLRTFLDQCSAHRSKSQSAESDLPNQPFASSEKIKEVHETFKREARGHLDSWVAGLMKYLQDEETVRVLVPPAQNSIVDEYRKFHDLIRAEFDFTTAASLMTPSAVHTLLVTKEPKANGTSTA